MDHRERRKEVEVLDSSNDQLANELIMLSEVHRALAKATTVKEVKAIRDKAEIARKYAQCAMKGLETQNLCAEIKLRAERKAGELLADLHLRPGRRHKDKRLHDATILKDLGVSKIQSYRWQKEAQVPEEVFQRYLAVMREKRKEVTAQGLLRLAQEYAEMPSAPARHKKSDKIGGCRSTNSEILESPLATGDDEKCGFGQASELVDELRDHRALLENLLQQFCKHPTVRSELVQRRTVARLLSEMQEALAKLDDIVHGRIVAAGNRQHRRRGSE